MCTPPRAICRPPSRPRPCGAARRRASRDAARWQIVVVDAPELLEQIFGLAAGVDEDQRGLVALDQRRRFRRARGAPNARPRADARSVSSMVTCGCGAGLRHDQIGARLRPPRLRHQIAAKIVRLGHGRRQADGGELRRQREQPRQAERQQIAALGGDERMQFVEHDAPERAEQIGRVGDGQQQRELLRRGQQDVGRIAALALALGGRRVAGAGFDAGSAGPSPRPAISRLRAMSTASAFSGEM